jgi:hypothetical protein
MVGTRHEQHETRYLADAVAARHGVAVPAPTNSPREAYEDAPPIRAVRAPWPAQAS